MSPAETVVVVPPVVKFGKEEKSVEGLTSWTMPPVDGAPVTSLKPTDARLVASTDTFSVDVQTSTSTTSDTSDSGTAEPSCS